MMLSLQFAVLYRFVHNKMFFPDRKHGANRTNAAENFGSWVQEVKHNPTTADRISVMSGRYKQACWKLGCCVENRETSLRLHMAFVKSLMELVRKLCHQDSNKPHGWSNFTRRRFSDFC